MRFTTAARRNCLCHLPTTALRCTVVSSIMCVLYRRYNNRGGLAGKGRYALCETIVPSGKRFRTSSVFARSEYIDRLATLWRVRGRSADRGSQTGLATPTVWVESGCLAVRGGRTGAMVGKDNRTARRLTVAARRRYWHRAEAIWTRRRPLQQSETCRPNFKAELIIPAEHLHKLYKRLYLKRRLKAAAAAVAL